MTNDRWIPWVGLLALGMLSACAATGTVGRKAHAPAELAAAYSEQARALESRGDIVEAAYYYQLALTVDPQLQTAADSLARIEDRRRLLAEEYYNRGLELYARGKYADSRRALLTALRLQPDHPGALEKLTARTRIEAKRFIVHTVQPGESISTIAKKYYGDPRKYDVIARYNNLPDATRIRLGQELKIPEIQGLPFHVDEQTQKIKTEAAEPVTLGAWPADEPDAQAAQAQEAAVQYQVDGYRAAGLELMQAQKYDEAIVEFNKVLSVRPRDEDARRYIYEAYFANGQNLLREKKFLAAKEQFEKCLALNSSCQSCHGFIQKCEDAYKEMHYQRGIQLFGAEKPKEAIAEWELVRNLDPKYKQVEQHIQKARKIADKIESMKQKKE